MHQEWGGNGHGETRDALRVRAGLSPGMNAVSLVYMRIVVDMRRHVYMCGVCVRGMCVAGMCKCACACMRVQPRVVFREI